MDPIEKSAKTNKIRALSKIPNTGAVKKRKEFCLKYSRSDPHPIKRESFLLMFASDTITNNPKNPKVFDNFKLIRIVKIYYCFHLNRYKQMELGQRV